MALVWKAFLPLLSVALALPTGNLVTTQLPGVFLLVDSQLAGKQFLSAGSGFSSLVVSTISDSFGSQAWSFVLASASTGAFNIASIDGMMLLSATNATSVGLVVSSSASSSTPATQWFLYGTSGTGTVSIANANNGNVLICQANAQTVMLAPYSSTTDTWQLRQMMGSFNFINQRGVAGSAFLSSSVNGALVNMNNNDDGSGRQRWIATSTPNYVSTNLNALNYNGILVAGGVSTQARYFGLIANPTGQAMVDTYAATDNSNNQKWSLMPVSDGSMYIKSLSLSNSMFVSAGVPVQLSSSDDGSGSQRWNAFSTNGAPARMLFSLSTVAQPVVYLMPHPAGATHFVWVFTATSGSMCGTLTVQDGTGNFHFVGYSGTSVVPTSADTGAIPSSGQPGTRWTIKQADGASYYYIKPCLMYSLDAAYLSRPTGATSLSLVAAPSGAGTEQWVLSFPQSWSGASPRMKDGWIVLIFFAALFVFLCTNCCIMLIIYACCCIRPFQSVLVAAERIEIEQIEEGNKDLMPYSHSVVKHSCEHDDLRLHSSTAKIVKKEVIMELNIFQVREEQDRVVAERALGHELTFEPLDRSGNCGSMGACL